ncbi:hypothetical protein R3P38DRAFT_3366759 [Favolaschia claudopus]|uniref:Integrase core domain-containing protein n=1 Tax=Favolaschia claudopus TaxID=2862362 RepID=A0AAW0ACG5_9AGAR
MVAALEEAIHKSADPLEVPMLSVMSTAALPGHRGRPRKEIDKKFLAGALGLRGPTAISKTLRISSRTVRRRALDYGLVEPGAPCYQDLPQPDGSIQRVWQSTGPQISSISNTPHQLDEEVADILRLFPHFGRTMIAGASTGLSIDSLLHRQTVTGLAGALRSRGLRVPIDRIEASYLRVNGAPPRMFGDRRIERKTYSVPGVNSLWHHDGYHGLIRWKMLTHAFIDGKS